MIFRHASTGVWVKEVREYASTREKLVDPVWFDNQGWEYIPYIYLIPYCTVPGYRSATVLYSDMDSGFLLLCTILHYPGTVLYCTVQYTVPVLYSTRRTSPVRYTVQYPELEYKYQKEKKKKPIPLNPSKHLNKNTLHTMDDARAPAGAAATRGAPRPTHAAAPRLAAGGPPR